jgi:transcription elongation GreA/GreB family factor
VSASSPIGQAILGRSAGDEVVVELPNGAEQTLEIVAVAISGAEPAAAA